MKNTERNKQGQVEDLDLDADELDEQLDDESFDRIEDEDDHDDEIDFHAFCNRFD